MMEITTMKVEEVLQEEVLLQSIVHIVPEPENAVNVAEMDMFWEIGIKNITRVPLAIMATRQMTTNGENVPIAMGREKNRDKSILILCEQYG